jgi:hypothetical protein
MTWQTVTVPVRVIKHKHDRDDDATNTAGFSITCWSPSFGAPVMKNWAP